MTCMCGDIACGSCGPAQGYFIREDRENIVYLCGGINNLSNSEAKDWREAAKLALANKCEFLDPMRRDYRGKELESIGEIINGDIDDIQNSDIVLVNAIRPSWGTAMEVFFACEQDKVVVTVCPDEKPSPWLIYHSSIIKKTWAGAFEYILSIV